MPENGVWSFRGAKTQKGQNPRRSGDEEGLGHGIIPTDAGRPHRLGDAQLGAVRLEVVARVLRAPVTVEDRARREVAVLVRHRQGRLRHLGVEGGPHRPADHRPGRQIEHDRQVEPALTGREGVMSPTVTAPGRSLSKDRWPCSSRHRLVMCGIRWPGSRLVVRFQARRRRA